jgi:uncharacterized protein
MDETVQDVARMRTEKVEDAFAAWAQGDMRGLALLSKDIQWTITGTTSLTGTYTSFSQLVNEVLGPIWSRLAEPLRPTVQSVVVDGDWIVATFTCHGKTADGRPYDDSHIWRLRWECDAVVEVQDRFDAPTLDELLRS